MKKWEYEAISDGMSQRGNLAVLPELREALANNGISLPGIVSMEPVREICRLILAERKTTEANADSDEAMELQSQLLGREIYVNRHDIVECRRGYCEAFAFIGWLSDLEEVDYIAARVSK